MFVQNVSNLGSQIKKLIRMEGLSLDFKKFTFYIKQPIERYLLVYNFGLKVKAKLSLRLTN
jgi:hypothetical protein